MNKSRLLGAVCACAFSMSASVPLAAPVYGQGTWETTLQPRDLDGNLTTAEAFYDTVVGITWLADANYAGTSMIWYTANQWATNLNPYGSGITGWRLPDTNPIDGTTSDDSTAAFNGTEDFGYNVSAPGTLYAGSIASELAHMFYNTLGNWGYCDPDTSTVSTCGSPQPGNGLSNTGLFLNVQSTYYWSRTENVPNVSSVWGFYFYSGYQRFRSITSGSSIYDAWAVHDGDVGNAVVPIPASVWLFGSGLLGLVGMARRKVE